MGGKSRSISLQTRHGMSGLLFWLLLASTSQADQRMPVTVVIARESAVAESIPVVGSLAAREEVLVRSVIQDGVVQHILVEAGDIVAKGQPLAILDTAAALLELDKNGVGMLRARAAIEVETSKLDVAKVREREALKVLERSRSLQPKGAVSQQLLEEHENAYARAVAESSLALQSLALAQADAGLIARERAEIELKIERSTIRAPEAGLVLRRAVRIGAMTSSSGDPLFVLAKDSAIEFVAQVTETSFVRLEPGMRAEILLAGHQNAADGVVRLAAAEMDPVTRSGEVRVELADTIGLKPGAFARGNIGLSPRRNIVLPGSAVKTAGGASSVFVVENGVVDRRQITVGARQDGLVEIIEGLDDGEMVVLKSAGFLKMKETVRPVIASGVNPAANHLAASTPIDRAGMMQ